MAINIDLLQPLQVAEAEDLLVDIFKDSDIDCNVGTTVRELVIRPMAVLRASEQAIQDDFFNKLNLYTIADGGEANSDTLEAVASTYRIKRLPAKAATGSILVSIVNDSSTYIPQGVTFTTGEYSLYLDKTYVILSSSDTDTYVDTDEVSYIKPYTIDGQLCAVIPVHTDPGVVDVIPSGTELSFSGTISNIASYTVLSPISGGVPEETDQDLAKRILYGVVKGYLSTPLQIKAAFSEDFSITPNNISVFGVNDAIVNRSVNPITNISQGGFVDIYANTSKGISTTYVSGIAVSDNETTDTVTRTFTYTLEQKDSAGVYDITRILSDDIEISDVSFVYGLFDTPHKIDANNARFSAFQKITVSFSAKTNVSELPITLECRAMKDIFELQNYVDSDDRRAPGQDTIVKAAIPCVLGMSLSLLSKRIDYDAEAIKQAILSKIHNMPIGTKEFTVEDIIDALKDFEVTVKFPVVFTGTIISPNKTVTSSTTTASFVLPAKEAATYDRRAVSFFSNTDIINLSVSIK